MASTRLRTTHNKRFGPASVSAAAAVWTPAAGRIIRLQYGEIGAGASGIIHVLDGTAGTPGTLCSVQVLANAATPFDLGDSGRLAGTANFVAFKADSGTITNVTATLAGREERY